MCEVKNQFDCFINSEPLLAPSSSPLPIFNLHNNNPKLFSPKHTMFGKRMEEFFLINIKNDSKHSVLEYGLQIIDKGITIGELDFILKDKKTDQILHVELAYKFYLYNPNLSQNEIECWVGPNKNDFLHLKLKKLTQKQFPLLYHFQTKKILKTHQVEVNNIKQNLCFIGKLFIPYNLSQNHKFLSINKNCIDGYWITQSNFYNNQSFLNYQFYIPTKHNWHTLIPQNLNWHSIEQLKLLLSQYHQAKKSPQVWVKTSNSVYKLFITWWN